MLDRNQRLDNKTPAVLIRCHAGDSMEREGASDKSSCGLRAARLNGGVAGGFPRGGITSLAHCARCQTEEYGNGTFQACEPRAREAIELGRVWRLGGAANAINSCFSRITKRRDWPLLIWPGYVAPGDPGE